MTIIHPITIDDAIHIRGKHLYKKNGTIPFTVKGIAFPTPPEEDDDGIARRRHRGDQAHGRGYDAAAWLALLRRLRLDLDLDFNAVRLYRMRPDEVDYSEFLEGAAALGVYVIVPLTSATGDGVLDRTRSAPGCYSKKLFRFGAAAVATYLKHPNVLAGTVGNEVMNDEEAWRAAPCVRAYARDLKSYMGRHRDTLGRALPLMYAAQDASVIGGAEMDKDDAMRLTAEYLTCAEEGRRGATALVASDDDGARPLSEEDAFDHGESPIDIVGVNVESWCSSAQGYERNPDGTPGSYYSLHSALANLSVPVIFSEMGCPHSQFDKDDPERRTKDGARDWAQVPVVMNEMSDSWSGFVAYTLDGPEDFDIMSGGPWDGERDDFSTTEDFDNFKEQLDKVSGTTASVATYADSTMVPRRCSEVISELSSCCDLRILGDGRMHSFRESAHTNHPWFVGCQLAVLVVALTALVSYKNLRKCKESSTELKPLQSEVFHDASTDSDSHGSNYGTL